MTMKTAQDISPAAIVCLSLAMLIGNLYVAEISEYMGGQKAEYASGTPSGEAKAMLADVSEGRRLERTPDYSESSTGQVASAYSQDVYSEAIQKVAVESSAEDASYQELRKLSAENFSHPAPAGDSIIFLLGACSALLAVVIMRVDILETAEQLRQESSTEESSLEDRKAESLKMSTNVNTSAAAANSVEDIVHTTTEDANHILSLKSIILICALALSALGLHVISASSDIAGGQESSSLRASIQELQNLAASPMQQDLSIAPDSLVMLVLGAFILLAMMVMKNDVNEMAKQATSEEGPPCEPVKMPSEDNNPPVVANSMEEVTQSITKDALRTFHLRVLIKSIICICAMALPALGLLVPSVSFDIAGGQETLLLHASVQELKNLAASPMQPDSSIAPDRFVLLVLGAFVVLAVTVMKSDVDEMAKEATSEEGSPCKMLEEEKDATPTMFNDTDQLRSAKLVFYISAAAWAAVVFLLWACTDHCEMTSPSVENEIAQELRATLVAVHQHSSIAPDNLVMLGLVAFSMLAMVVMRTDVAEMAAESHKTPTNVGKPMAEPLHDACSSEGQAAEPLKIFVGDKTVAVAMTTMHEVVQIKGEDSMQVDLFVTSIVCICAVALPALGLLISSASFEIVVDQQSSYMHASAQELRDLVAAAVQHHLSFAPDSFVMLVLAAFVLLAMVVMKVDVDELANEATSEEVQSCKVPEDKDNLAVVEHAQGEVAPTTFNDLDKLPRDKSIGFCMTAAAFAVAVGSQCLISICEVGLSALAALVSSAAFKIAVGQEPSPLHASTQELKSLAAGRVQQDSSFSPDSLVMLGLGAFVLLAMMVMKVDVDEMANEATREEGQPCKVLEDMDNLAVNEHVEGEVAPTTLNDLDQHPRGKSARFGISAVALAAIALLLHLACADLCKMLIPSVENASIKELKHILVPVYQHSLIASDRLVMLMLGACSLLTMAVMKTDISEMAEKQDEAPRSDAKAVQAS